MNKFSQSTNAPIQTGGEAVWEHIMVSDSSHTHLSDQKPKHRVKPIENPSPGMPFKNGRYWMGLENWTAAAQRRSTGNSSAGESCTLMQKTNDTGI